MGADHNISLVNFELRKEKSYISTQLVQSQSQLRRKIYLKKNLKIAQNPKNILHFFGVRECLSRTQQIVDILYIHKCKNDLLSKAEKTSTKNQEKSTQIENRTLIQIAHLKL